MVTIYTARVDSRDPDALDITVKSAGVIGVFFAPTWEMVWGVKKGRITEAEYTERYLALLRRRYHLFEEVFVRVLQQERVVLCCYCAAGQFCHRHLLVDVLEKIARAKGIAFVRGGEIHLERTRQ